MTTPAADILLLLVARLMNTADKCMRESRSSLNAAGQLYALPTFCCTDSMCYADHPSQLDIRRLAAHHSRLKG